MKHMFSHLLVTCWQNNVGVRVDCVLMYVVKQTFEEFTLKWEILLCSSMQIRNYTQQILGNQFESHKSLNLGRDAFVSPFVVDSCCETEFQASPILCYAPWVFSRPRKRFTTYATRSLCSMFGFTHVSKKPKEIMWEHQWNRQCIIL